MSSHNKDHLKLMLSVVALNQSDRQWLENQLSHAEKTKLQHALSQLSTNGIEHWLHQVAEENDCHDHIDGQLLFLAQHQQALSQLVAKQPTWLLPVLKNALGDNLASQVPVLTALTPAQPMPPLKQQLILQSLVAQLSMVVEKT